MKNSKLFHKTTEYTNFGFEKIPLAEKTSRIEALFNRIADSYDLMNDIMSGGLHRVWKDIFVRTIDPKSPEKILDLAGGTGDVAFRISDKTHQKTELHICDLSSEMLKKGKLRALDQGFFKNLFWINGSGEQLPYPAQSFDKVTISFGLRNVTSRSEVLSEIYRILKSNGTFFCLEFSKPIFPPFRKLYEYYSFSLIPRMGALIAKDRDAYQYLVESIAEFPDQKTLLQEMKTTGFLSCGYDNLSGGIAAIHWGKKEG